MLTMLQIVQTHQNKLGMESETAAMDNFHIPHNNIYHRIYIYTEHICKVLLQNSPSAQTSELILRNCIEQLYHSFQKAPLCMSVLLAS